MRIFAIIMVVITVLAGIFLLYCYNGMEMQIEKVGATMTPVVEALGTYDEMARQVEQGTFYGKLYTAGPELSAPGEYAFLTLTVRMANRGLFPMDWIRIEVTPEDADILQLPAEREPSLAAGTRGELTTVLLTRAGAETARAVTVTYYALGKPYTVRYEP